MPSEGGEGLRGQLGSRLVALEEHTNDDGNGISPSLEKVLVKRLALDSMLAVVLLLLSDAGERLRGDLLSASFGSAPSSPCHVLWKLFRCRLFRGGSFGVPPSRLSQLFDVWWLG